MRQFEDDQNDNDQNDDDLTVIASDGQVIPPIALTDGTFVKWQQT